jgi:hypothetical protein
MKSIRKATVMTVSQPKNKTRQMATITPSSRAKNIHPIALFIFECPLHSSLPVSLLDFVLIGLKISFDFL